MFILMDFFYLRMIQFKRDSALWSRISLKQLAIAETLKKFSGFHGLFESKCSFRFFHFYSICWARWIWSVHSHHVSSRHALILSSQLSLALAGGFFLQVSLPKPRQISGFCRSVVDHFALLRSRLPTFRESSTNLRWVISQTNKGIKLCSQISST